MAAIRRLTNIFPCTAKLFRSPVGQCYKRNQMFAPRNVSRPFTRSLWCATKDPVISVSKSNRCGCCDYHTEGDAELAEFLKEEIKMESQQSSSKMPSVDGFQVEKSNCDLTFTKSGTPEIFRVTFNVNNAIEDESEIFDENEGEPGPSKIRCKPPFVVEIGKSNKKILHIQCQFPNATELAEAGVQDTEADMIEITDVAILNEGEEWTEKAYSLQGGVMDGNLYDMILHMMEERGLDVKVMSQLVDYCTAYEHKQYLGFLQELQNFAESS